METNLRPLEKVHSPTSGNPFALLETKYSTGEHKEL